jgi:hypothetical protein
VVVAFVKRDSDFVASPDLIGKKHSRRLFIDTHISTLEASMADVATMSLVAKIVAILLQIYYGERSTKRR